MHHLLRFEEGDLIEILILQISKVVMKNNNSPPYKFFNIMSFFQGLHDVLISLAALGDLKDCGAFF